ncbi:hypothetical protein ABZ372_46270, partial [Streptomyces sp. NPDC005921]
VVEALPGGPLEQLASYDHLGDPAGFAKTLLGRERWQTLFQGLQKMAGAGPCRTGSHQNCLSRVH